MKLWNNILELIDNNEINNIVNICKKIDIRDYNFITKKLIEELKITNNISHRNTIAIVLGDLKCNDAIEPIIELINNPNYRNCRGSLVYALEELDCEDRLRELINLLLEGNWEVKCNMYTLLEKKINKMNDSDKMECLKQIKKRIEFLEDDLILLEKAREEIFHDIEEKDEIEILE